VRRAAEPPPEAAAPNPILDPIMPTPGQPRYRPVVNAADPSSPLCAQEGDLSVPIASRVLPRTRAPTTAGRTETGGGRERGGSARVFRASCPTRETTRCFFILALTLRSHSILPRSRNPKHSRKRPTPRRPIPHAYKIGHTKCTPTAARLFSSSAQSSVPFLSVLVLVRVLLFFLCPPSYAPSARHPSG
jgi:hypothetical protein